jgi:hypothetical protein
MLCSVSKCKRASGKPGNSITLSITVTSNHPAAITYQQLSTTRVLERVLTAVETFLANPEPVFTIPNQESAIEDLRSGPQMTFTMRITLGGFGWLVRSRFHNTGGSGGRGLLGVL